jgi:hypothetical protein
MMCVANSPVGRSWYRGLALMLAGLMWMAPLSAADPKSSVGGSAGFKSLDTKIQDLKKEVVDLNRDLFVLEEELLFPASTQLAVFLSLDVGKLFALDAVQVKLDDKVVANYLYTERELEALRRGGVHRLYLGNLKAGKHELVAFFVGKGPHERDYKRGTTIVFEKDTEPKFFELQIKDATANLQPEFQVKEWK